MNPNVVWLDFSKIDFGEKNTVKKLVLDQNENYAGESSHFLKPSKPFKFAGLY
jgi:choloylglycine hydrolase